MRINERHELFCICIRTRHVLLHGYISMAYQTNMADKSTTSSAYVYNEARRLYPELIKHIRRTPLEKSTYMSRLTQNSNVYIKLGKLTSEIVKYC